MNPNLSSTLDMIRSISAHSDIKIKRGYADFLADRIIQACTQKTLLGMAEKLAGYLNCEIAGVYGPTLAAFTGVATSKDAPSILKWLREFPKVAAMIVVQKQEEYESIKRTIQIDLETVVELGVALPAPKPVMVITMKCTSPLAHGADNKAGNASLFRRMQVLTTTNQVISLPFYAGNAFRGQMRDTLADHFLGSLGMTPRRDTPPCNLWFFHALYAGGCLEENSEQAKRLGIKLGSNGAVKAEGIHELRNMIPCISLLGSALGNRILSGRLNFSDFKPQCHEWNNGGSVSVGELFEWLYLTRREDHEAHEAGENSSMIANTECLKAGTVLLGGIDTSAHMTDIEKSCLGLGLKLIQKDGFIGAENRRGFGKVEITVENAPSPELYESFLKENKEKILKYLGDIYAIGDAKPEPVTEAPKAKKGRGKKEEVVTDAPSESDSQGD